MSAIFGELLNFPQEQGPEVRLRVFGDERYARYEDIDGYTMVYDKARGLFCYATLAGNRFVSTGVPLDQPPPPTVVRHLRESLAVKRQRPRKPGCCTTRRSLRITTKLSGRSAPIRGC